MKWIDKKYEIIHSLGGGGFSDVYLVNSPEGRVALKLLKTEITLAPNEKNLICFKNEFTILKNLNHPNIARILDFGLDEEQMQYYFTSEYVEGTDIFNGTKDADIEMIIRLFAQALRALEYLHSYRIFHFDIKAANVLLTKDNVVKLIDFGLASLDPKGKLMGTPSYMPPEIVRREKPDGRADIYSLGVLWYYCLTKKNPFKSPDPRVTIDNQKNLIPPAPSTYNPEIPKYIDQIILRMLEKRPEKRYERASQIIKEMNLLGGLEIETETSETLLSYIPEKGRFIGRKKEISLIKDTIHKIKEKEIFNHTFLITGKNGVGKKRFLDEIKYYAQLNDLTVESADGHNQGETEKWLQRIDEHFKEAVNTRAFLIHSVDWLEATPQSVDHIRNMLSKIPAFSKKSPTIIAITLDGESPLVSELKPLTDKHLELKNFNVEELTEYISSLTGLEEVPRFLTDEILKRTEGNPLFVTEIAKSLISSGALFDSKGRWKETSFIDLGVDFKKIFPESLKDLFMDKYHNLSKNEKMLLSCLAVADRPSSSFELTTWTGLKNISILIENLIRKDILVRKSAYDYFFRNELFSGYIYEDIAAGTKEKYHDIIADYLIEADAGIDEIVKHIGRGSDHRKAFEETFQLGCKYLKEGSGKKAIENFEASFKRQDTLALEEKIELNIRTGEAYLISQDYKYALKYFNVAENLLSKISDLSENVSWHIDNLIKIGGTYIKVNKLDKARKSFQSGQELLKETGPDRVKDLILQNWEGYLALQEGQIDLSEKIYSETRSAWKNLPKSKKSLIKNNELGTVLLEKGEREKAIEVFKEDLSFFKEIKDELLIARRYYNIALSHKISGEYDSAAKYLEKVANISRKNRDIELLFCAYNELGNIYNITQEFEQSRKYYERARGLSFQSGDFKSHAAISINLGIIENNLGHTDLAYYELSPAIIYLKNTEHKSLFDRQILSRGQMEMADILIKKGHFPEAEKIIENAKESAKHLPADHVTSFWLLLIEAHLYKAKNDDSLYAMTLEKLESMAKSPDEKEALKSLKPFGEDEMEKIYARILEINKLIGSEKSVAAVLKIILKHALEISGAESAAIVLKGQEGDLNIAAHLNVDNSDWNADISHTFAKEAIASDSIIESEDAESDIRFAAEASIKSLKLKSVICLPIHVKGNIIGALYLDNRSQTGVFKEMPKKVISIFTDQIGIAIDNAKTIEDLSSKSVSMKSRLDEMSSQLKHYEELMDESVHGFSTAFKYENIIGRSKEMSEILQTVDKIMDTDIAVLITGESGTGKELIAKALHYNSRRSKARFVTINCGAIPSNLIESELFGYKAGAFTGANQDKKGLFEEAHGGTIFLDEITELEAPLQVKLLRVLQEKEFHRIGDTKPRSCDVRIITATNKDIDKALKDGIIREDLYWRICQIRLHLPPLRERREDIPLLVKYFLGKETGEKKKNISARLLKGLIEYDWPGNIRELQNLISVTAALSKGDIIDESCIPENYGIYKFMHKEESDIIKDEYSDISIDAKNRYRSNLRWEDYERIIYAKAYEANDFKARKAAKELHVAPTTMYNKIKNYHLDDHENPIYKDPFKYEHGHSLRSYEFPIFNAALKSSGYKASRAISKLGISQGFFYKVMKHNKHKAH